MKKMGLSKIKIITTTGLISEAEKASDQGSKQAIVLLIIFSIEDCVIFLGLWSPLTEQVGIDFCHF